VYGRLGIPGELRPECCRVVLSNGGNCAEALLSSDVARIKTYSPPLHVNTSTTHANAWGAKRVSIAYVLMFMKDL
jgi:hypothetical protein